MADKNQQSLLNGAPPQLFSTDSNPLQPSYMQQNQSNLMNSSLEQNSYSQLQQKRPVLMVNGRVPQMNIRNSNNPVHNSGLFGSNSDNSNENKSPHHTQSASESSETSTVQMNKSLGSTGATHFPKVNYSSNSPVIHQNANFSNTFSSISQAEKTGVQTSTYNPIFSSTVQSNIQLTQKQQPSPIVGNKLNILPSGNFQPVGQFQNAQPPFHNFSQTDYQQIAKPPPLQPPPVTSPYTGPPKSVAQPFQSSPAEMPSTIPQSYESIPYTKPQNTSSAESVSSASILPPGKSYSPLRQGSQSTTTPLGMSTNPPPLSSASQTFPPPVNQPGVQTNRWTSIPQCYQLKSATLNQHPRNLSMTNATNSKATVPPCNQSNLEQIKPTFQNQLTPNRTLDGPPPPSSSEVLPIVPMPRGPIPSVNQMPLSSAQYDCSKYPTMSTLAQGMEKMSVTKHGFNKMWGLDNVDLLQCRNILPPNKINPPPIRLHHEYINSVNCRPDIIRCTMNKIPETNSLLQKSRLPLGILVHPFKDLSQLAVIQCSTIVRCRVCRTYINPFVYFVDNKRWKCNLCFRINELPDEFQYDPVSKTYGDPWRRPEIRNSTIEFIAPSEYMLRPPQPAIYLFVLDVSRSGCDSGYLDTLCSVLLEELDNLPGDCRTQIGFILFDSYIHFFSIEENYNQAHEMIVTDINDVFLPTPDSLLVNLNENKQLVRDLLQELPKKYAESYDTDSALGAALQAAYKLMTPTGGRITVFQSCLPNVGPGSLNSREDPNQRSAKDVRHLGPQTDFYKRLSLDCSTQQISVDLFLVSSQYSDLATIGGISQFSGGCIYYFPLFRKSDIDNNERLMRTLKRYLTRKIGFEAVMRVRCSRGLTIHTFHGNFFVRSTDLLSLPNVNPDAGFGMQVSIEDSLCELQTVCFQAAILYTSAKGERRIRVHTLCLPVSSSLSDILMSADQQAIVGLLGKMAVDRSLKSSLSDAREAFINVAIDILSAYKLIETSGGPNSILAPNNLALIPLYILALLKSTAFRTGQSTRLDDRVYAMSQMKTLPLREFIQLIHPDLYNVTQLDDQTDMEFEDKTVAQPPRLSLSSEHLDSRSAFLLDTPEVIYVLIGKNIDRCFINNIFNVNDISQINNDMVDLPEVDTEESEKLRHFIGYLQSEKVWPAIVKVITEPNVWHSFFVNDKDENALSYYELLHHVKAQIK